LNKSFFTPAPWIGPWLSKGRGRAGETAWGAGEIQIRDRLLTFATSNFATRKLRWRQFMKIRARVLLSVLVMLATMFLVNCSPYSCNVTFGASTCTPSGSGISGGGNGGGGGGGGGGTTISAANATALVYFVSGTSVDGAGFGGSTFAFLSSYTAPTLPANFADNMTIVNKQFVYIPMGDTTVQGFSITRSTGALTAIPGTPFTVTGGTADGAWADPQGRFLFVGSEGSGDVWVFQINAQTGALTETAGSPFTAGLSSADIMTVDASGKFLYVGQGLASAGVAAFSIGPSGALTAMAGSPFNLGVAQIHASLTGEFLLGVAEVQDAGGGNAAIDPHIYVFSVNPVTGVPSAVSGSPFPTAMAPFDFAISPNGKFVYTVGTAISSTVASPIEGFQMDTTTGALTTFSGSPFNSLPAPSQCQFEQTGTTLICVEALGQMSALIASPATGSLSHGADMSAAGSAFATTD
jgi:6-phosphogluconolactonase (cycloisomerase 2 family)